MKKNEGKIRNIHSRQDREKLKEAEFDSKLYSTMRSNFAKEGKKIAGELENDKKLDYVGDAPDLLNKIVGQLREEGKWDDNAYRQECKKNFTNLIAAGRSDCTEKEDGNWQRLKKNGRKQKKNYAAGSNHCAGRRSFCGWIRSGCEQRAYYEYLWESRKRRAEGIS